MRVAIDDFGTGYSSLSRLSELPVDTLKIDRTFIAGLPHDRAATRLVPTIIALARAFELLTVAEGVETQDQFAFLKQAGCNAEDFQLKDHGILGNGHFMMLETNRRAVFNTIQAWLAKNV